MGNRVSAGDVALLLVAAAVMGAGMATMIAMTVDTERRKVLRGPQDERLKEGAQRWRTWRTTG